MTTTTDKKSSEAQFSGSIVPEPTTARHGIDAAADNVTGVPKPPRRPRRMAREPKAGTASVNRPATGSATPPAETSTIAELRQTKSAAVLALLRRKQGATLDQLVEVTGWLPHTARAALTGLRKKGHAITSSKEEGQPRVFRAGQA